MNYPLIIKVIGKLLIIESVAMSLPMIVSLIYGQADYLAFLIAIATSLVVGLILSSIKVKNYSIKIREGLVIVTIGWLAFSIFGAIPFFVSGAIPNVTDAFFETISGFTTTGASILTSIETLPYGILFWRSFTHWLGGMGILVFTLAVFPKMDAGSFQIIKAEFPGPVAEKMAPRVKDTAVILYLIYIGITVIQIILLMFGGMNLYDSVVHSFATVGTGGFSTKSTSIAYYESAYIQWVITFFMMICGTNFSLYYLALRGKWRDAFRDEEMRLFWSIAIGATIIITADLAINNVFGGGILETLRYSAFQVSAMATTTGYTTANFEAWPSLSKAVLIVLFLIGGCSGSTGGGIKNIRLLIALKSIQRSLLRMVHPRAVVQVKINGKSISNETINIVFSFLALWGLLICFGTIVVAANGATLLEAFSATAVTLTGLGVAVPAGIFAEFNDFTKYFLTFLMLVGRLELFTVLALFLPSFWKR